MFLGALGFSLPLRQGHAVYMDIWKLLLLTWQAGNGNWQASAKKT
jgi:hypothetical protein